MVDRVKRVQGVKIDPEVLQLAENEIAIRFMEHPELESQVKEKIADVLENKSSRQVIEADEAAKYLKKNLGIELASVLCSMSPTQFNSHLKGKLTSSLQSRNLGAAYVIVDILLSHLIRADAVDWLINYSDYLAGVPAIEMSARPEDVRTAALYRVTAGKESPSVY